MRSILAGFMMLFYMNTSQAQIFEIGPYLGGSNLIGDVGATKYINPNSPAFGGVFKWNRSLRYAWRATLIHTSLKADDVNSNQEYRKLRGYSFSNSLTELTLGMEFNFWEFDIYSDRTQITPYIATGISGTRMQKVDPTKDEERKDGNLYSLVLPMIIGAKGKLTDRLNLGVEVGARMAFHDDYDGSRPRGGYHDENRPFGSKNNDWYMFSGLTLTYTFGRTACYDIF